ncbi:MAG: hypothetical protein GXZ08_07395 [Tissierellia bacterium]|nr:hypothetical protein [Tissierellia bacterium]
MESKRSFRTLTSTSAIFGEPFKRLVLELNTRVLVEVKAKVDLETGDIRFFIEDEDLAKVKSVDK